MVIEKNLLTKNPMSRPGTPLKKITNVVIHYTDSPGTSALANKDYFENLKNQNLIHASSHYLIGLAGEIIQCVPENEIAYCINTSNNYSISIENCHPDASGKFNDKTYASLIELSADICMRYKLRPAIALIRHYDVTKKKCPPYYVNDPAAWNKLKADVSAKLCFLLLKT